MWRIHAVIMGAEGVKERGELPKVLLELAHVDIETLHVHVYYLNLLFELYVLCTWLLFELYVLCIW